MSEITGMVFTRLTHPVSGMANCTGQVCLIQVLDDATIYRKRASENAFEMSLGITVRPITLLINHSDLTKRSTFF
nr:hypothetical transcript [Hymenolepis microstoma]